MAFGEFVPRFNVTKKIIPELPRLAKEVSSDCSITYNYVTGYFEIVAEDLLDVERAKLLLASRQLEVVTKAHPCPEKKFRHPSDRDSRKKRKLNPECLLTLGDQQDAFSNPEDELSVYSDLDSIEVFLREIRQQVEMKKMK